MISRSDQYLPFESLINNKRPKKAIFNLINHIPFRWIFKINQVGETTSF